MSETMTYEELAAELEVAENDVELAEAQVSKTKVDFDNLRSDPENDVWDVGEAEDAYDEAIENLRQCESRHKELARQWGEANGKRASEALATLNDNEESAPATTSPPSTTELDRNVAEARENNVTNPVSMSARKLELKRLRERIAQDIAKADELEELIERDERAGQAVTRYEAIKDSVEGWDVRVNHKGNFELWAPIDDPDNGDGNAHVATIVGGRQDLVECFFTRGCKFPLRSVKELIQIGIDVGVMPDAPNVEPVQEEEESDEENVTTDSEPPRSKPYREAALARAKQLKKAKMSIAEISKILTKEGMPYSQSGVYNLLKNE